eukprot:PhM_4_TR330/c1_g1_i1/m.55050
MSSLLRSNASIVPRTVCVISATRSSSCSSRFSRAARRRVSDSTAPTCSATPVLPSTRPSTMRHNTTSWRCRARSLALPTSSIMARRCLCCASSRRSLFSSSSRVSNSHTRSRISSSTSCSSVRRTRFDSMSAQRFSRYTRSFSSAAARRSAAAMARSSSCNGSAASGTSSGMLGLRHSAGCTAVVSKCTTGATFGEPGTGKGIPRRTRAGEANSSPSNSTAAGRWRRSPTTISSSSGATGTLLLVLLRGRVGVGGTRTASGGGDVSSRENVAAVVVGLATARCREAVVVGLLGLEAEEGDDSAAAAVRRRLVGLRGCCCCCRYLLGDCDGEDDDNGFFVGVAIGFAFAFGVRFVVVLATEDLISFTPSKQFIFDKYQ